MMNKSILPAQWRAQRNLSMAAVAEIIGLSGKNPARTWQRWENGEREPPLAIILKIEGLSGGQVTTASWVSARHAYRMKHAVAA